MTRFSIRVNIRATFNPNPQLVGFRDLGLCMVFGEVAERLRIEMLVPSRP